MPTQAHSRRPRCRWWLLALLALTVTAIAMAATGWLPHLANALIREYLRVRDLSAIQVRVERLTPWNLRAVLQLGTNGPASQIDRLECHFSPSGLRHARLDRVEIDGGRLQFSAGTNGLALCGLPADFATRIRPGASPVADVNAIAPTWQIGKMLVNHLTLRLRPPQDNGSRGRSPSLSITNSLTRKGGRASPRAEEDSAPFDLCLHASAVTDPQGEMRFALSDYGRAGWLIHGAVQFNTGDGWLVAVLPENQVQGWLHLAQWYVQDPRFQGGELCAGTGGAHFLARMKEWRPALVQGDLSLRAATLLQDYNCTYDLQLHGVAQWTDAESLRPTLTANADLDVRMASGPAFAWSDDHELPARASLAMKLTPKRAEWECLVAAHATLSHEAAQTCLPPGTVLLPEAPRLRLDGVFTSPDLVLWDGTAETTLRVSQPRLPAGDLMLTCSDLVVQAKATMANSKPVSARGHADASGLQIVGRNVACDATASASFESSSPWNQALVAITARVDALTIPAGTVVMDAEHPAMATVRAQLQRNEAGAVTVCSAHLQTDPIPVMWKSGRGEDATAVLALSGRAEQLHTQALQIDSCLRLTNLVVHAGDLTGGIACVDVRLSEELKRETTGLNGLRIDVTAANGWLDGADGRLLDGLRLHLPLAGAQQEILVAGTPGLTWRHLECDGVPVQSEGFSLALTGTSALVSLQAALPDAGVHATLQAHADWSRAWQVAVTATVPPTVLADTESLRSLIRKFSGQELGVTGMVSATVRARLAADTLPRVQVMAAVTNLDVSSVADKWQVSGIAARVTADGPQAWRTPQGEELSFRSAKKGDVVFDGGTVRWQFRHDALLVEQADVSWCDGWLHAYGVPLELQNPCLDTELYAEQIELGRLMQQVKALQGTGSGRLYGRIPLKTDRGGLRLAQSYLYSMPGETGILKLSNVDLIDQALEQGGTDAKERQQVCEALHNLRYSGLRLDLSGGGSNAVMSLKVSGRSAEQMASQPVELDVNLHGALEDYFNFGLQVSRKWK